MAFRPARLQGGACQDEGGLIAASACNCNVGLGMGVAGDPAFAMRPKCAEEDQSPGRRAPETRVPAADSLQRFGPIVTLQRGAEWVATGKVTQKVPKDFPTEGQVSI
ncbi:MAG: hypothetical protein B7Z15_18525, partial [Rhizobiales bacterium 32-66-8]